MADEDHIRELLSHVKELLKRDIERLEENTRIHIQSIDRLVQTQLNNIEKATQIAMETLNERLKGWPEKMDAIEKKVAAFEGKAMVFGGIAGAIISVIASIIASVIIFRMLG